MPSKAREIRWSKPALDFFLDELEATDSDVEAVNSVLIYVRDHPDTDYRVPVDKDGYAELAEIEGEIFLSYDKRWEIYYSWLPAEISVVHIARAGK